MMTMTLKSTNDTVECKTTRDAYYTALEAFYSGEKEVIFSPEKGKPVRITATNIQVGDTRFTVPPVHLDKVITKYMPHEGRKNG